MNGLGTLKAFRQYLPKTEEDIFEEDIENQIILYETTFDFLKSDLEEMRSLYTIYDFFNHIYPWAYDLDATDLVLYREDSEDDNVRRIHSALKNYCFEFRVIWYSFFKHVLICPMDDFFNAIREICEMGECSEYFKKNLPFFKEFMVA